MTHRKDAEFYRSLSGGSGGGGISRRGVVEGEGVRETPPYTRQSLKNFAPKWSNSAVRRLRSLWMYNF